MRKPTVSVEQEPNKGFIEVRFASSRTTEHLCRQSVQIISKLASPVVPNGWESH